MFIVISNPTSIANEASQINELFDLGMSLFHLRKPHYSDSEMRNLLREIYSKNHSKIALHSCHHLTSEFDIKRLHFTEEKRKLVKGEVFYALKQQKFTLSSSVHFLADVALVSDRFDYVFCSPVFDSISKTYRKSANFDLSNFTKPKSTKLIGLGGIDRNTVEKAMRLGFDGVAVLGAIWNSESPKKEFKILNEKCHSIVQ